MATEDQIKIPVYDRRIYKCVRGKDLKDYRRLELERYLIDNEIKQPFFYSTEEKSVVQDAVFVQDYLGFLDYLAGKKAFLSKTLDKPAEV